MRIQGMYKEFLVLGSPVPVNVDRFHNRFSMILQNQEVLGPHIPTNIGGLQSWLYRYIAMKVTPTAPPSLCGKLKVTVQVRHRYGKATRCR